MFAAVFVTILCVCVCVCVCVCLCVCVLCVCVCVYRVGDLRTAAGVVARCGWFQARLLFQGARM